MSSYPHEHQASHLQSSDASVMLTGPSLCAVIRQTDETTRLAYLFHEPQQPTNRDTSAQECRKKHGNRVSAEQAGMLSAGRDHPKGKTAEWL